MPIQDCSPVFNYFISDSSNKDTHYRTDKVEEAIGKVGQCGYTQMVACVMPQVFHGISGEVTVTASSVVRLSSRLS